MKWPYVNNILCALFSQAQYIGITVILNSFGDADPIKIRQEQRLVNSTI
jgi:hypothetical protein